MAELLTRMEARRRSMNDGFAPGGDTRLIGVPGRSIQTLDERAAQDILAAQVAVERATERGFDFVTLGERITTTGYMVTYYKALKTV